ncbi:mdj1 protein precursor [Vanrija albida]|uniref:Mdj1 protein n=1 Tax=Vanrija albida TaxID=181172 RepID=A0ABR3Q8B0_9TREE
MPPRVPTRAFSALSSLSQPAVASSSAPPAPPASRHSQPPSTSPQWRARSLHTAPGRPSTVASSSKHAMSSSPRSRAFHASSANTAEHKNPYETLGVAKDAKAGDIKKAYYALAKKWHPDSNKEEGAAEKFHEIQAAYDILSDDTKRQAYDQYGSASTQEGFDPNMFSRGGAGGFGGFQDFGGAFGGRGGNAGDLFEQLFGSAFGGGASFGAGGPGGAGPRARQVRGDDLESSITLSFNDACAGVTRKVMITPVVDCQPCHGSGLKPGEKKATCGTCRGTGQQAFQVQGMFMASTCPTCGGTGSVIPRSARCDSCDGVGRVKERKEVDVEIPAGIEDGMKIKIPGAGDMPLSAQGPPGDLYVRVNVKPSSVFRRQGTNLYHEAKVPLQTALLGGRVRVPTLEGDVEVRIREGTQYGQEAVLKGRGVKSLYGRKGERGDLIVSWKIQIPRTLTATQKKIFQAYADDVEGRNPHISFGDKAASGGWTEPPHPDKPRQSAAECDEHDHDTVSGKMAHAFGSAVGWAERMLGGKHDPKAKKEQAKWERKLQPEGQELGRKAPEPAAEKEKPAPAPTSDGNAASDAKQSAFEAASSATESKAAAAESKEAASESKAAASEAKKATDELKAEEAELKAEEAKFEAERKEAEDEDKEKK